MRNASGAAFATFSSPGSDTELSICAAPNAPAPRTTAAAAAGIEDFERADRRHHHRQAQFAAERLRTDASTLPTLRSTRGRNAISSSAMRLRRMVVSVSAAPTI